jgi:hypothetical protein
MATMAEWQWKRWDAVARRGAASLPAPDRRTTMAAGP